MTLWHSPMGDNLGSILGPFFFLLNFTKNWLFWDLGLTLFDIPTKAVFAETSVFSKIFDFLAVNGAPKWTKTITFQCIPFWKFQNFEAQNDSQNEPKNQFFVPILTNSQYFYKNRSISDASSCMLSNVQNFNYNWQQWAIPGKIQIEGLRVYFLKIPLEFLDLSLCPRKFWRKQAFPLDIPWFFLYTSGNSTPFLIDPRNFHMFFLQYPWKFHVLNPRYCFDFFWNSPF